MRTFSWVISLVCAVFVFGVTQVMAASPAEQYISSVIKSLNHTESIIPDMKKAADDAAARWVSGGHLYVTDDETFSRTGKEEVKMIPGGGANYPMREDWGGFVAESCDRAGGFRQIQPVPVDSKLTAKDVVLAGTVELKPEAQVEYLKKLKETGALIIVFGSKKAKAVAAGDYLIDNGLDAGLVPVMTVGAGKTIGETALMANVINMWTFSAELVAAVNRQGKMPTLWQSMFVPGAAPRNFRIEKMEFDPDVKVQPVKAGVLGRQFVAAARSDLRNMKKNELKKFADAGKLCAETIKSGNKVVAGIVGHFMVAQMRMPDYPALFKVIANEYGRDYLSPFLKKGDVFLNVGYSYTPQEELALAREVGAKTVCVFTPGPVKVGEGTPVAPNMSQIDIYIDPYWKHGDSVVAVPGYDTKIIPVSGVVMISSYWMILGETVKDLGAGKK
ncbi:MAG: hypothetical protein WCU00_12005 [Candidatus Latescibacterota bacterium]